MIAVDFSIEHIEQAAALARAAYAEERGHVPCLPAVDTLPGLEGYARGSLGAALVEEGTLLGFLCCEGPIERFFGLSAGVFAPVHAHGALKERRAYIYDRLYQAAAEKWVARGLLSHAVQLYAHDADTLRMFFDNGFGNRCVDAVRPATPIGAPHTPFIFRQLGPEDAEALVPMKQALNAHFRRSPIFMRPDGASAEEIRAELAEEGCFHFAAFDGGVMAAFIQTEPFGENFAAAAPSMSNITGAYTTPQYRGSGVYPALLNHLLGELRSRGFAQCGVDFESFNYTARGFWLKHFTAYTNSVVRRIDERVLDCESTLPVL